jgi:hypothetical protein
MRFALVALLVLTLHVPLAGQRPYFATPPPGTGPIPMAPYGEYGGCPEEPAAFHRCALEKAKTFTPARTSDGRPDLQGYWTRIVARNMENIEDHPQGMDGSGGKSLIVDPPDGRIPYQPWAAAKVQDHFSTYLNPVQRCLPDAPPKHAYSAGVRRIIQAPSSVFILGDYAHTYRVIPWTAVRTGPHRCVSTWATRAGDGTATRWLSTSPICAITCGSITSATSTATPRTSLSAGR